MREVGPDQHSPLLGEVIGVFDVTDHVLEAPLEHRGHVVVATGERPAGCVECVRHFGLGQTEDPPDDHLRPRLTVGEDVLSREKGLGDHPSRVRE